jgi:lactoylglutathione lyase
MGITLAHVALWAEDLERLREFYVSLGAQSGNRYVNPKTGFQSYFVSFGTGPQLELMSRPDLTGRANERPAPGYAHIALRVASRAAVDELTASLEARGIRVGYYESVVADPEGNLVELTA